MLGTITYSLLHFRHYYNTKYQSYFNQYRSDSIDQFGIMYEKFRTSNTNPKTEVGPGARDE